VIPGRPRRHLYSFQSLLFFPIDALYSRSDRARVQPEILTVLEHCPRQTCVLCRNGTQLVLEAAAFPAKAGLLDPFVATELDSVLAKLPEGEATGQAIIDGWIKAFRASNPTTVNDENPFNNPLHPKIQDEFASLKVASQATVTVVDACKYVFENGSWGTMQEVAMRQATASDFETAIREMDDQDEFRRFMQRMIEMRLQRANYDSHFGTAAERFVEACRTIANDTESPRLAALIRRLFGGTALASELVSQSHVAGQAAQ
jgi:hypothetical protein